MHRTTPSTPDHHESPAVSLAAPGVAGGLGCAALLGLAFEHCVVAVAVLARTFVPQVHPIAAARIELCPPDGVHFERHNAIDVLHADDHRLASRLDHRQVEQVLYDYVLVVPEQAGSGHSHDVHGCNSFVTAVSILTAKSGFSAVSNACQQVEPEAGRCVKTAHNHHPRFVLVLCRPGQHRQWWRACHFLDLACAQVCSLRVLQA